MRQEGEKDGGMEEKVECIRESKFITHLRHPTPPRDKVVMLELHPRLALGDDFVPPATRGQTGLWEGGAFMSMTTEKGILTTSHSGTRLVRPDKEGSERLAEEECERSSERKRVWTFA